MEKIIPKIGIIVWTEGGRITRSIDLDALAGKLAKAKNMAQFRIVDHPWAAAFSDSLRQDLKSGRIDRILWIGRFTSEHVRGFTGDLVSAGLNSYLQEWLDLSELGVLAEQTDAGLRNRKAEMLIRMAMARLRLAEPLDEVEIPASDAVLIIGAGVSGLHTALSLAEIGKKVHLVERESGVGGKVALLSRFYPRICDPHCGLEFTVQKLADSHRVTFHTLARLVSLEGSPGNFTAKILKQPRYVSEKACNGCGACMKACPVHLPESSKVAADSIPGVRKAIHPATPMAFPPAFVVERNACASDCRECEKACPNGAIDLDQTVVEEALRAGAVLIATGWDPYPLARVEEYGYGRLPGVVSNLDMERLLTEGASLNGLKEVGFIQCLGSRDERHVPYCSSVCCSATLKQVLYLKERFPEVRCTVFYQHIRTPGFEEDLYRKARMLGDVTFVANRPATVEPDGNTGKLTVTVLDPVLDKNIRFPLDLLVLAGGMCPALGTEDTARLLNLPLNPYGFFESHPQCHPEESQRTGIYVGGCCREPMNVSQSIESSHRAAMKALKFLQGSVRIRPEYPVLDKTKCDQCKRCTEDCPFSSFVFDEKGFPSPDLVRCRQCGNCMGVCPLAAISLRHHTIKQTASQIEAINPSFMGGDEPAVLAFLCENDAWLAAKSAVDQGFPVPPNVVALKVSCAGSVNNALVADALSMGIDGILIAGCRDGQCHYVRGNQLVQKRSGDLRDKLKKMMIEPERVRFESLEIRESRKYVEMLDSYIQELKSMGPNPFKV